MTCRCRSGICASIFESCSGTERLKKCCQGLICSSVGVKEGIEIVCLSNGCKGWGETCDKSNECCIGLDCNFDTTRKVHGCYYPDK